MMKRVFIVALVIVLVAVFVAPNFFVQQTPPPQSSQISFDNGFNQLKSIWSKQGIAIDSPQTDFEKIPLLSSNQLSVVQSELEAFKAGLTDYESSDSKQSLLLLSDIYIGLSEISLFDKQLEPLESQISNVSLLQGCESTSLFRERNSLRRQKNVVLKELSDNVDTFISSFPSENVFVGLNFLGLDFEEIEADMQLKEFAVTDLEANC